jgi:hypothetical protein
VNNSHRILAVKPTRNAPLEDREGDERIMLKWILGDRLGYSVVCRWMEVAKECVIGEFC